MAYKITIIKVKYLKEGFYIQISPFTMGMEFFTYYTYMKM